jgi:hypothetical protein
MNPTFWFNDEFAKSHILISKPKKIYEKELHFANGYVVFGITWNGPNTSYV